MTQNLTLTIERLADLGDGVGTLADGRTVFVPHSAPHDVLEITPPTHSAAGWHATIARVLQPSPQRSTPPCPHYTHCGGCNLQHLSPDAYASFKHARIARWVQQLGQPHATIAPLWSTAPATRRRASMRLQLHADGARVGFQASGSHQLIDTPHCALLTPELLATAEALRQLLPQLKKPKSLLSAQLTLLENGIDINLELAQPLHTADQTLVRTWAETNTPIARAAFHTGGNAPQRLYQRTQPEARMGNALAEPPIGAFLQATATAQQHMAQQVCAWLAGAKTIAELYCGMGTFTLPLLAQGAQVHAWEGSEEAIHALHNAARRAGCESYLQAETRDVYRTPIPASRLRTADAVLINPPRNGALPQCKEIAQSGVATVVMVSCNPATSARDAKALLDAGYQLHTVAGVDQFLWSAHLELVALFVRP